MGATTTTTVTELVAAIIGEARMWMADTSLFYPKQGIATQFLQWKDLRNVQGKAATFPKLGSIAFGDSTEGEDYVTTSALDTSAVTVTASRKKVIVPITDEAEYSSEQDLIALAGKAIGIAAAEKFDNDVFALFSSLGAGTSYNASGSPVTAAEFQSFITALRTVKAPGPYAAIFHPWGWYEFLTEASSPLVNAAASDSVAKGIWNDYYQASPFGVRCFTHADVNKANADADYLGAFLSPYAIGCVWKRDLAIETERDASASWTEYVATMDYGLGVIDSTMGIQLLQDAD